MHRSRFVEVGHGEDIEHVPSLPFARSPFRGDSVTFPTELYLREEGGWDGDCGEFAVGREQGCCS